MVIRRARQDEWAALRDLRLRALASDPDAFGETLAHATAMTDPEWQARTETTERAMFVAEASDGSLAAMAMGGPAPDRPAIAAVFGMWVAPEARGQGVGASLLDAVEAWARSAGFTSIGLGVTTTNAAAIRLYERAGFADLGDRFPLREGTGLTIQIMGKPL